MKTINLSDEDYKDFMELAKELRTQDDDSTRNPMWTVCSEHRDQLCIEENADEWSIYSSTYCQSEYLSDIYSALQDGDYEDYEGYIGEEKDFLENVDNGKNFTESDLLSYLNINDSNLDISIIPVESYIKYERNAGLFKAEVQDHIKSNHYHYGKNPHTYGFCSWRMPKTERLLNIIRKIGDKNNENN